MGLIAFHGKQSIKDKYLKRVREHQRLDEIHKGQYFEDGAPGKRRMCAVGCTVHSSSHQSYETELGIPRILAKLEDGIFEALPNDLAKTWPRRFLEAVKPGSDLSSVWPKFAVWLLTDSEFGVLRFAKTEAQREAIQTVSDMYLFKLSGADIDPQDWRAAAAAAAYAAAAADADAAAADAAAAAAADADADADAYAAYAAYAAAAAYAYAYAYAAREKMRIAQSEKLLELLREAK